MSRLSDFADGIASRWGTKIVDIDKKTPNRSKVIEKIIKRQLVRQADNIEKWSQAVRVAEDADNPDRTELIRIFDNMDIDGHITGIVNAIKNKIKAKGFMVEDDNGEEIEDETLKFETEWFFKYLDWNVEAKFKGFSLIETGDIVDDGFPHIQLVPRANVVPDRHIVKKDTIRSFDTDGKESIDYTEDPYKDWLIFIGSEKDLGLYNIIAPLAIAKKHAIAAMWEYIDMFGTPMRIGRTDITDPDQKLNMDRALDNMGSAFWASLGTEDTIEFIETSREDAQVFLEGIKFANEEISKAFAGATGMFDEKSFVGSAEVQERLFDELITSYMRQIKFDANNKLLPRMKKHGMLPEQARWVWKQEDGMSPEDAADILQKLLPFYTIMPDTIEELTGIKVEATKVSQEAKDFEVAEQVKNLYKLNIFKKDKP